MPELPEVETIVRDLQKSIVGKVISAVRVNSVKPLNTSSQLFKEKILCARVHQIKRRGKYIIIHLIKKQKTLYLVIHLRMSGQLIVTKKENEKSRISFNLKDIWLNFLDQRHFGRIWLVADWRDTPLRTLGPDAWHLKEKQFLKIFAERIKKSPRTRIKLLLLDQQFISGVGNIYAAEILFRAKISPERRIARISPAERKRIFAEMKNVLGRAIKLRGTTFDYAYRDGFGRSGNFSGQLLVYGRRGENCYRCGQKLVSKKISGRTTVWCRKCQT